MTKYIPKTVAWEITMGCNMRCKHCGSSCEDRLDGELTTTEAIEVCRQLSEVGVEYVTLTGGEPLTRSDWNILANELKKYKIVTNVISNGWVIDKEIADKAFDSGVVNFAMSLDGMKKTHDFMRRDGSFDKVVNSLEILAQRGLNTSIITTINKQNINELSEMKKVLLDKGVNAWQLQFAIPMGSFHARRDTLMIEPEQVDDIIDFAYMNKEDVLIYLADCMGYYSLKEIEVRKKYSEYDTAVWGGCPAGKYSFGILHNGDVTGCSSIRDKKYIEGNVKKTDLSSIWKKGFQWCRSFNKDMLEGFCKECLYAQYCLGGCTNTRLCTKNSIYGENEYCSYRNTIFNELEKAPDIGSDINTIINYIETNHNNQNYNVLAKYIKKYLKESKLIDIKNKIKLMNYLHFAYFKIHNFNDSLKICNEVLKLNDSDSYALHGLALNYYCLGERDNALEILYTLVENLDTGFVEPVVDLHRLLTIENKLDEAEKILMLAKSQGIIITEDVS